MDVTQAISRVFVLLCLHSNIDRFKSNKFQIQSVYRLVLVKLLRNTFATIEIDFDFECFWHRCLNSLLTLSHATDPLIFCIALANKVVTHFWLAYICKYRCYLK